MDQEAVILQNILYVCEKNKCAILLKVPFLLSIIMMMHQNNLLYYEFTSSCSMSDRFLSDNQQLLARFGQKSQLSQGQQSLLFLSLFFAPFFLHLVRSGH